MLVPLGIKVKTLADFSPISIDENGATFEENATIKAETAAKKLRLPVMADDSGLVVDALNGKRNHNYLSFRSAGCASGVNIGGNVYFNAM